MAYNTQVIIGLDLGKRIGMAYAVDNLAMPFYVASSLQEVAQKIKEKRGDFLVIGWPLRLDGSPGDQCQKTKQMLDNLLKILSGFGLEPEIFLQDERFSSKFMNHLQDEHAHSAAWILQIFLDKKKRQLENEEKFRE